MPTVTPWRARWIALRRRGFRLQMLLEQRLDARLAHATFEAADDALAEHEHERRDGRDAEPLRELRLLVDVDPEDAHTLAFLAREMREQALHPARRTGRLRAEEDEQGPHFVH